MLPAHPLRSSDWSSGTGSAGHNVHISALIRRGGRGEQAVLAAIEGRTEAAASVPLLTETADVLTRMFHWERERVDRAVRLIAGIARVVKLEKALSICAHEPDNRVPECALAIGADLIVTADRHLLALCPFQRTRIVTLTAFLELVDEDS